MHFTVEFGFKSHDYNFQKLREKKVFQYLKSKDECY